MSWSEKSLRAPRNNVTSTLLFMTTHEAKHDSATGSISFLCIFAKDFTACLPAPAALVHCLPPSSRPISLTLASQLPLHYFSVCLPALAALHFLPPALAALHCSLSALAVLHCAPSKSRRISLVAS